MSRTINVDGAAGAHLVVSDAVYAAIEWGSEVEDVVTFELENGGAAMLHWVSIGSVFIAGSTPPPGSYPGWIVNTSGPYGGTNGLLVNDATKDILVAALTEADTIVEFTTLQGTDIKLPSKNATVIDIHPGNYVVTAP